jgi:hypothetical protein
MLQRIRSRTVAQLKWHSHRLGLVMSLIFALLLLERAIAVAETPRAAPDAPAAPAGGDYASAPAPTQRPAPGRTRRTPV